LNLTYLINTAMMDVVCILSQTKLMVNNTFTLSLRQIIAIG
jgi:hypothetical protein